MSTHINLALHSLTSVALARGVTVFDGLQGDLAWSLSAGISRLPRPQPSGPVLQTALLVSAGLAGVLAFKALGEGSLARHRRLSRRAAPLSGMADTIAVGLLAIDMAALATIGARARHIRDIHAEMMRWVSSDLIVSAPERGRPS